MARFENGSLMLTISPLPKLPAEAIDLVNDGVYSLYALRDHAAVYLLVTDNGGTFYYLATDGEVLDTTEDPRFDPPLPTQIAEVVRFESVPSHSS